MFRVEQFNPFNELKSKTDKITEKLINIGAKILVLKNKLGDPSEGSIAERIYWNYREWSNLENSHLKSAQGLA